MSKQESKIRFLDVLLQLTEIHVRVLHVVHMIDWLVGCVESKFSATLLERLSRKMLHNVEAIYCSQVTKETSLSVIHNRPLFKCFITINSKRLRLPVGR